MRIIARKSGARQCAPLVVTLQRHASIAAAPVAATCRRTLVPGQLRRQQRRGLRLCTLISASSGSTSGSAGEDQPLASDNPPAEVERQEERAIFLGGCSALLLVLGLVQVGAEGSQRQGGAN